MELLHEDVSSEQTLNCPICNYKATCTCKYQSHIETHVDPFDRTMFKCFFCGHRVKTLLCLREHMFVHGDHSEKFKCYLCNVFCKSEMDFKGHLWLHQSLDKQTFKCIYCDHETYSVNIMKMHMLIHKNYIAVQGCCLCHYKSKSRGDLLRHLISHKESPNSAMFICNFCEYKTEHLGVLRLHLSTHEDEIEVFKCCACDYECHSKVELTKHFLIHKDYSNLKSFKCPFCSYTASYLGEFRLHILKHRRSENSSNFCVCQYNCQLCDYKTNNKCDFELHFRESHKTYYLKRYEERYKDRSEKQLPTIKDSLEEHYLHNINSSNQATIKLKTKPLNHVKQNKLQNNKISKQEQNKVGPEKQMHQCDKCSFSTWKHAHFKRHNETHRNRSERKLFHCTTCPATFTTKFSLKTHAWLHVDPEDRPMLHCEICEYKTLYGSRLNEHIKSKHANETKSQLCLREKQKTQGQYQCDECSFCAIFRSHLRRHKETHKDRSERKLFECTACGTTLTTYSSFKLHNLLHVDPEDRPMFHCEQCEYKTIHKGRLNKHIQLIHSKVTTFSLQSTESKTKQVVYKCKHCSYKSNLPLNLKRHQQIHKDRSERLLYECASCSSTYVSKKGLTKHIFLLHMGPNQKSSRKKQSKQNSTLSNDEQNIETFIEPKEEPMEHVWIKREIEGELHFDLKSMDTKNSK